MPKKHNFEFREWFESQFGKPPLAGRTLGTALERQRSLSYELYQLEKKINATNKYAEDEKAALYAWNAARDKNG